ncbi:methyl-accepting chemotaxis protein [Rhizobium herbae]|uniref:Methyl-accepting chemotaxis protein n=2 Tax=Rhizobium herbae TaxID=508661 RepID=A0ABS4EVS0_9HYPH|nr:HAMP domain-containing methyl-accepting chemotaxis protein [Rhizobium herbae]MBP1862012.1 methyl-accepting chemotaxis protein [Rhizobium herbae]
MIDKIMSRFKIQTKVVLLVLPFVISISAVGLTGLYASGLLQGRMEISNSVLQSLSGFKHVFTGMSDFLMTPTQQNHDRAAKFAEEQLNLLKATTEELRKGTDVALLDKAVVESQTISENIETIWVLQKQQESILADVANAQAALLDKQGETGKRSFKLIAAAKRMEKAAKKSLTNAMDLDNASVLLDAMASDHERGQTLRDKFKSFEKYSPDLEKSVIKVLASLPTEKQPDGKKFEELSKNLIAQVKAKDMSEAAMNVANTTVGDLRPFATTFKQVGRELMRQSILNLAAADIEISNAEGVANKLRAIVGNNNEIRVVFAELAGNPSEEAVKKVERALYMYATEVTRLSQAVKNDPFFAELPAMMKPILDGLEKAAMAVSSSSVQKTTEFVAASKQIEETWQLLSTFAETQKANARVERDGANRISIGAVLLGIVIAMAAGAALVVTLKGPIGQITSAMRRLADGRLDTSISGDRRPDEIGDMARALAVFKDNALAKVTMEEQTEQARLATEEERSRNEAEKQENAAHVQFAVDTLARGLGNLARGDLRFIIETPFASDLDQLRNDFNSSVAGLRDTLSQIRNASGLIQENGRQVADAADDLAKRTEQQAASLEETAAAVGEITAATKTASARAGETKGIVATAKRNADNSSGIVQNAISAMSRIKGSSDKISQIIDVIDGIAFQTNLLALNAGVEAARAGEAGKGFAVVAQEVRELAQRSAKAAKEIGGLIANSAEEVSTGSRYVEETGNALIEISRQIVGISGHIDLIANSTSEQSLSLQEINSTVNQMDQMTQRNAAMVEETNAATRQLSEEADLLMELVGRFALDAHQGRQGRRAA